MLAETTQPSSALKTNPSVLKHLHELQTTTFDECSA